jgi:hypothetical protein
MSQPALVRFALTTVETPICTGLQGASLFFKTLTICNQHSSTRHVYLGIVRGTGQLAQGDYLLYHYDVLSYDFLVLSNVLVPDGHQLRGYAQDDTSISLVAAGVVGP